MARVPYVDRDDLPPQYRRYLDRPINLVRALANSPEGLARMQDLGEWLLQRTTVDPRLRELAILRVGHLNRSTYEFSHHLRISSTTAVTDIDRVAVAAVDPATHPLDALALAVLRATDELTVTCRLEESTWHEVIDALGVQAAVELVIAISHYNSVTRVLRALEVDVEPDYAEHLQEFPIEGPNGS